MLGNVAGNIIGRTNEITETEGAGEDNMSRGKQPVPGPGELVKGTRN